MLRNLATSFFKHEKIETTTAKAKEISKVVERVITQARRGDLHSRRLVASYLSRAKGRGEGVRSDRAHDEGPHGRLYADHQDAHPPGRRRRTLDPRTRQVISAVGARTRSHGRHEQFQSRTSPTKRGERTTLRSSPLERRTAEHADPRPGLSGAFAL